MELHQLQVDWQALGQQLAKQEQCQRRWSVDRGLARVRGSLRWLVAGQVAQLLLGIALVVLGVACWSRNPDVPVLLGAGILVHGFGVLTLAMAGITLVLLARMDYDAPVLPIARQVAQLRRVQAVNALACGLPWWLMWVLVVVAVFGLQPQAASLPASAWLQANLWLGAVGLLLSALGLLWWHRRERAAGREGLCDGSAALRRAREQLRQLEAFERDGS